ncbi:MAG: DUF4349 domain-containing protein [Oscillospiraceae bacterium]|nr:DUF4349 domain-containing protein [Oscillospiraceae bacterium]
MKRLQLTAALLAGMCLLASCGESNKMDCAVEDNYTMQSNEAKADYSENSYDAAEEADERTYSMDAEAADYTQAEAKAINTQMLVYSCEMSIDVMEFDDSVDKLHDLISKYKGFIESETYSDGGNTSQWKYNDEQKWKTLSTLIRIPSASYDDFCKDAEGVGDIRRKNASVQNLSTEYSDLKTTLKIYEAKEKRYIDLLADMKSESEAISVEKELTNIQVEIARIKTRMNNIENDVAYSYINLTVNEVREYTAEPVIEKTDTFGQRLMNTVSKTWRGFLEFLEGLLFLIIRVLPYLLLLALLLFPINRIRKAIKKKRAARDAAWYQAQMNAQMQAQAVITDTAANTAAETAEVPQEDNPADQQ